MNLTFRQFTVGQVHKLAIPLIRETMGEEQYHIAKAAWATHRPSRPTRSWGLWLDGKFAGFIGLGSELTSKAVWLGWFAVVPAFQGHGWGMSLLKRAEQLAAREGYESIYIETYDAPQFIPACHLYDSAGYLRSGYLTRAMESGMTAYYFSKILRPSKARRR